MTTFAGNSLPPDAAIDEFPFAGEAQAALAALEEWKNRLLDAAVARPTEALVTVLTSGALIFYLAERDVNEDVRTYGDALHYISTCFSVGYARIYPVTQIGKLVASVVMVIGPAITSWILEGRLVAREAAKGAAAGPRPAAPAPDLRPVVERLDAILAELKGRASNP